MIIKVIISLSTMYSIKWCNLKYTNDTILEIASMFSITAFIAWIVYEIMKEESHNKTLIAKEKLLSIQLEKLLIKKEMLDIKRERQIIDKNH